MKDETGDIESIVCFDAFSIGFLSQVHQIYVYIIDEDVSCDERA